MLLCVKTSGLTVCQVTLSQTTTRALVIQQEGSLVLSNQPSIGQSGTPPSIHVLALLSHRHDLQVLHFASNWAQHTCCLQLPLPWLDHVLNATSTLRGGFDGTIAVTCRATMVTGVQRGPTSSCQARHTQRRAPPLSTLRAGRSAPRCRAVPLQCHMLAHARSSSDHLKCLLSSSASCVW